MARPHYYLQKDQDVKIIFSSDIQEYLDRGYINVRRATDDERDEALKSEQTPTQKIQTSTPQEIEVNVTEVKNETVEVETSTPEVKTTKATASESPTKKVTRKVATKKK